MSIREGNTPEYKAMVERTEARLGFPICGAPKRDGGICLSMAGKGTDHLHEGKCSVHGGRLQSPLSKNWRHGKNSVIKTTHPILRERMEALEVDHDVFSLEEEILKLRAISEILADNDDFVSVAKNIVDMSKVIERLHNIQVGRKYYISIENVSNIIDRVKEVIFRHVPDEHTRHLIAQDLASTRMPGLPAPAKTVTKLIEGEVLEE